MALIGNIFSGKMDIQNISFEQFKENALNIEQIDAQPKQVYEKVRNLLLSSSWRSNSVKVVFS